MSKNKKQEKQENVYIAKNNIPRMGTASFLGEELAFKIKDSVYLKTDIEQLERIVTGITLRENCVTYALSYVDSESWHYGFEITKDRDIVKATT